MLPENSESEAVTTKNSTAKPAKNKSSARWSKLSLDTKGPITCRYLHCAVLLSSTPVNIATASLALSGASTAKSNSNSNSAVSDEEDVRILVFGGVGEVGRLGWAEAVIRLEVSSQRDPALKSATAKPPVARRGEFALLGACLGIVPSSEKGMSGGQHSSMALVFGGRASAAETMMVALIHDDPAVVRAKERHSILSAPSIPRAESCLPPSAVQYPSGEVYEGEYNVSTRQRHGKGKLTSPDGTYYEVKYNL